MVIVVDAVARTVEISSPGYEPEVVGDLICQTFLYVERASAENVLNLRFGIESIGESDGVGTRILEIGVRIYFVEM